MDRVAGLSINTPVAATVYRRTSAAASSTCRNWLMLDPVRESIQYSNARESDPQKQPSVGHQAVVVKGDVDAVGTLR